MKRKFLHFSRKFREIMHLAETLHSEKQNPIEIQHQWGNKWP